MLERYVVRILTGEMLRDCGVGQTDKVLAAVSGGADSTALLLSLQKLLEKGAISGLAAAHLHHGIRGGEADEDQAFCRALCRRLQVPFYTEARDVPALAALRGETLEQAAREARYDFLRRVKAQTQADWIAVAHNREDQAETLALHLLRGSGLAGLGGMRPRRGDVIRPLLTVSRGEIEAFLQGLGQPWRTDSTNGDPAYARNRVRRELARLDRQGENATLMLARAAGRIARDEEYLQELSRRAEARICDGTGFDRRRLAGEDWPIRARILRRAVLEIDRDVTEADMLRLDGLLTAQTGTCIQLRKGMSAWVDGERLYLGMYPAKARYAVPFQQEGITAFPGGRFISGFVGAFSRPADGLEAYLDGDALPQGLTVRTRLAGDRFFPIGAPGDRKLSDFLTDRKVPRTQRDMPLLAAGERVYYVAGLTVAQQVRVRDDTKRILHIVFDRG